MDGITNVVTGTGLDWTGLDWTGLDWTGLDWTPYTIRTNYTVNSDDLITIIANHETRTTYTPPTLIPITKLLPPPAADTRAIYSLLASRLEASTSGTSLNANRIDAG